MKVRLMYMMAYDVEVPASVPMDEAIEWAQENVDIGVVVDEVLTHASIALGTI